MGALNRSVDVVVVGAGRRAIDAAAAGVRRGLRVLVVIRSRHGCVARHVRRAVQRVTGSSQGVVTILTGVEVVCVAGINSVEAVLIRRIASGRLLSVNAASFLTF
jgi:hypothetical protein